MSVGELDESEVPSVVGLPTLRSIGLVSGSIQAKGTVDIAGLFGVSR